MRGGRHARWKVGPSGCPLLLAPGPSPLELQQRLALPRPPARPWRQGLERGRSRSQPVGCGACIPPPLSATHTHTHLRQRCQAKCSMLCPQRRKAPLHAGIGQGSACHRVRVETASSSADPPPFPSQVRRLWGARAEEQPRSYCAHRWVHWGAPCPPHLGHRGHGRRLAQTLMRSARRTAAFPSPARHRVTLPVAGARDEKVRGPRDVPQSQTRTTRGLQRSRWE